MHLSPILLLTILVIVVLAKNAKDSKTDDAKRAKAPRNGPPVIRSRRSAYSAIWSEIKLAKEATNIGCKEMLKKAIDEAQKTVGKALDTIITYSDVSLEAKMAMKQIFGTLTDETKTPKQKVERVRQLEEKLSVELKDTLKPNTDPKVIDEAAHFFGNVPRQIELDKQ